MIVIKAGGNAIWPRASNGIDLEFMECLFAFVRHTIHERNEKVVLLPGGVGGQHFIAWARESGCSEAEMNHVGCDLINLAATIISRYFLARSQSLFTTCPVVALAIDDLDMYANSYDLILSGVSMTGGVSSDSLAALAAEHLKAKLIFIKNRYPYEAEHEQFAHEHDNAISLRKISEYIGSKDRSFRAGCHASIDQVCLRVLERAQLDVTLISKKDLAHWHSGNALNMIQIRD